MNYKIGFEGVLTTEVGKLLQSIDRGVNGFGMHAQKHCCDVGVAALAERGTIGEVS